MTSTMTASLVGTRKRTAPALALAWELWRRGRLGIGLLVGLALLALGMGALADAFNRAAANTTDPAMLADLYARASFWRGAAAVSAIFGFGFSFLIICALVTRVDPSPTRGFTGMPSRLFTLPVHSRLLAGLPMFFGVVATTLLCWAWQWGVFEGAFFGGSSVPTPYLNLLLIAWLLTQQAIVWSLPGFPYTRMTLLTALGFLGIGATVAAANGQAWDPRSPVVLGILFVWSVLASGAAIAGVAMTRRGRWQGWEGLSRAWDALTGWTARRRLFDSGSAAQFWIEFRRTAWTALGVLAVWDVLFLVVMTFWSTEGAPNGTALFHEGQWVFILYPWTIAVGAAVARDPAGHKLSLGSFTASRPLPTGALFLSKLKAMVVIWIGGLLGTLALSIQLAVITGQVDAIGELVMGREGVVAPGVLLAVVASFNLLIGLLPLWLTGRFPGLPWSFLMVALACGAVATFVGETLQPGSLLADLAQVTISLLVLLKLVLAFAGFGLAYSRGLVSGWFVAGWSLMWFVLTLVLAQYFWIVGGQDRPAVAGLLLLTFPLARIAWSPIALEKNRCGSGAAAARAR